MRRLGAIALVLSAALGCGGSDDDPPAAVVSAEVVPVDTPASEPTPDAKRLPDLGDEPAAVEDTPEPEPEPEDPRHGKVGPGDSLNRILGRVDVPAATAAKVVTALEEITDPTTIAVGRRYDITLDEGGQLQRLSYELSPLRRAEVTRDEAGAYAATLVDVPTDIVEEELAGEIDSSLWAAMADAGNAAALVDVVVDVFAYDIDFFSQTRKGDTFRIVVQRHEVDGEHVRYGRVLAAEYAGSVANAFVMWWPDPSGDGGRYVDADGQGVERTLLKKPLKYTRISSGFSTARMHPVLHRMKSHRGIDYAAAEGTPVWAAADGTITFRDEKGGAGNLVVIKHDGGLTTQYMHLSKFASGQRVGDSVKARTVIGYVGMTGLATGPHLHFGVLKNGVHVDPLKVEAVRRPGVDRSDRAAFERDKAKWQARLAGIGQAPAEVAPAADAPEPTADAP